MSPERDRRSEIRTFTARGVPALLDGNWTKTCGQSETIRQSVKVCAAGEGNPLHAHTKEDHSYFVLHGSATFINREKQEIPVRSFEGIMIPRGAFYGFTNTGTENLIMLLTFGPKPEALDDSQFGEPDINVPAGQPAFTGGVPGTTIPGKFFDPA
jgi:mannose-6-phosphate isomerase-like protein (cupin superfamily)